MYKTLLQYFYTDCFSEHLYPKQLIFQWTFCCMPTVHSSLYMWRRKGIYIYIHNLVFLCILVGPCAIGLSILNLAGRGPMVCVFKQKKTFSMNFPMWCERPHIKANMRKRHWLVEMTQMLLVKVWSKCECDPLLPPSYELECRIAPGIKVWQC